MLFPVEILEQILIHIDPVSLIKLRTICKLWKEIIDKILQDHDIWYKICKKDIPGEIWCSLLESLYPSRSYPFPNFGYLEKDVEILMNMYKWWSKLKNLIKYNTSVQYFDPIPKHRFQETITCVDVLENLLAIGTSEGYIYFYDIDTLDEKPIYVADHMEFVCKVQFLKNDRKCLAVSSSINSHVKFWNIKSKELVRKERGKVLCVSPLYCYIAVGDTLVIQGFKSRTFFEIGNAVAGIADSEKLYVYDSNGSIKYGEVGHESINSTHEFYTYSKEPPEFVIRQYYMFKKNIAVCVTECGHLGFATAHREWKFQNVLPILHGIPTAVLIYTHLLILGLDSGHICIYYVEDFATLDMANTMLTKRVILDTEPIISLDINAYLKQYIIAASSKRVHFIHFT